MKTPEQMADKWYWANLAEQSPVVMLSIPVKHPPCARKAFLAGYQAAKDQLADADKVVCSTTMEEIKAVDTDEITPITNLPTPAKWISVKERLPEVNTWCLWLYPFGPEVNQYEGIGKGGALLFHRDYYNCDDTPTHWMPLPELPKGEE